MWGDLDMPEADAVSRGVAGRANAVVVSVDYRLADEPTPDGGVIPATRNPGGMTGVHAPIPHEDVLASFDWVRDQAEQLGIDPARVAIGGASAGGNLAASVSLHLADAGRAPAASLLLYPALHGHLPEADADELAAAAVTPPLLRWDVPQTMWMAENYLGRPLAEAEPYDFPGLATAPQLAALPPTYIEVDEFDDLRPSGRLYAETLHEAGVDVTYVVRHGVTHGHLNRVGLAEAAQSMDRMAQIVREL
jgi:xylan 1,4-beta-xylosidase